MTYRNEALALVGMLAAVFVLPVFGSGGYKPIPGGVMALGLVPGATLAMQALGVVLVYRSHRFINFGQVYIGAIAAVFFGLAVRFGTSFRLLRSVCPPCLDTPSHTATVVNYWFMLVIAMAIAVLVSWAVYLVVVKRLEDAPRLLVMVASIFLGPAAGALAGPNGMLYRWLTSFEQREQGLNNTISAPLPFNFSIHLGAAQFNAPDILTVVAGVAAAVGLWLFLRYSSIGTAIRASSENAGRAETLGISVHAVNTRVWFIVGLLSGVPALLGTMSVGGGSLQLLSVNVALRILFVAVIARFVSLPMAAIAALVFGVLQQAVLWVFNGSSVPLDGAMVFLVAGLLLLQSRQKTSRAEIEAASGWRSTREIRPIPPELRSLPSVRKWLRVGTVAAVVVTAGLPWAMSPAQTNLATAVLIYAIVGLSLLVLTGWTGQVSLGQFAFAAIGGYVAAVFHLPFLLAIVVGGVAGAVVATLIGIPALRLRGLYLAISTLAFAVSVTAILINPRYLGKKLPSSLNRPSLLGMDFDDQRVFYYFTIFVLALVVVAVLGLRRSRTGRVLIASRDNEQAAQSFGISLVRARLSAFAVSGFFAALAGGLYAFHQNGVTVNGFNESQSFQMFTMTVIGGLGSVSGPIIGALFLGVQLIFGANPLLQNLLFGVGGLGLLLLMPGGLSQLVFGLRDAMLRRVAKRHRLVVPSLVADTRGDRTDGRGALAPKLKGPGGGFVPRRYGLSDQWALHLEDLDEAEVRQSDFVGLSAAGEG
jgi:branched-chain amino acid transport system permease protein